MLLIFDRIFFYFPSNKFVNLITYRQSMSEASLEVFPYVLDSWVGFMVQEECNTEFYGYLGYLSMLEHY